MIKTGCEGCEWEYVYGWLPPCSECACGERYESAPAASAGNKKACAIVSVSVAVAAGAMYSAVKANIKRYKRRI